MITITRFTFNPFQVHTYVLHDETGECLIVDPGCCDDREEMQLESFINEHGLKPVRLVNTHCHIDHVLGNNFVFSRFGLRPEIHPAGLPFLSGAREQARLYGMYIDDPVLPENYLNEDDSVTFGHSSLRVLYTPGHADGSICLHGEGQKFVLTGDALFRESIGRTDFPTGDLDILLAGIKEKLFVLDDDTVVYPGHLEATSIGHEKKYNPFFVRD
jgi:glyoxylase-like metal-dependent hydrolase (beta-lactamase superfamily II)